MDDVRINWAINPHIPIHRQLRAMTVAKDGTVLPDGSDPNVHIRVGDIWRIVYALERAYQTIGEMSLKIDN